MFQKLMMASLVVFAAASTALAAIPAPTITSITGYSDGFAVRNGRYVGQLIAVPPGGTNRYKNYLASDSYNYGSPGANPYYWDINGNNFGAATGTLKFDPHPSPIKSVTIVSWTNTAIRVKVVASIAFVSSAFSLTVKTSTGQISPFFTDNAVGSIKGRAGGQCTWFAAKTRIEQGLSIPPTPWGTNGRISGAGGLDNGYRPAQWDCTIYSGIHIAIITSTPIQKNNADGSTTWTFTLSEYNAAWNESVSTSTRSYTISKPNWAGQRFVVTGIGTNLGTTWTASGYYR